MARNYNNYNNRYYYETSPRKLQPEYMPNTKTMPKAKKPTNNLKKKVQESKKKEEQKKQRQHKIIMLQILIGFAILFAISYRNSQIDEQFSKIQVMQKELSMVEKENEQLEVNIENGSNLNNLEQSAKELLGMQKLNNKQSVYVSLPKVDYIEGNQY